MLWPIHTDGGSWALSQGAAAGMVVVAGVVVAGLVRWISRRAEPGSRAVEIAAAIRAGALTFLRQEYSALLVLALVVGGVLWWALSLPCAVAFLCGSLFSASAGGFGLWVATGANVRTAAAAREGTGQALRVAFAGAAAMGLCVSALALLGTTAAVSLTRDGTVVSCFAMGASLAALLARVGGGIYTKAADMGADLVGKLEAGIPEDDPRNPAVVADNVGDNVGDVAGMGADLFESYVGALFSAIVLGAVEHGSKGVSFAVLLMAAGLGSALAGVGTVHLGAKAGLRLKPARTLNVGVWVAAALACVSALALSWGVFGSARLGAVVILGVGAGVLIGEATEHFTSGARVERLARACSGGAATNIVSGLGLGLGSACVPAILVSAATVAAYEFGGLFGIALAGVGMLCTLGVTLAVDACGPIADNAGGIAQMAELPGEVREVTDELDAVGNTTAAVGKGFAIGSAALTALALFASFGSRLNVSLVNLADPAVYVGVLTGAMLPFLFSSLVIRAVGRTAHAMVEEVRRQFRENPGLADGNSQADYRRCIRIATRGALRGMLPPALLAIAAPLFIWRVLNLEAVAGLLGGATVSGVLLAVFMANTGGAWDNAKKFIEAGNLGGRGSFAHQAAVVGDTVGDPLKDSAGPSLNILIKLIAIVSIVVIPILKG